MPRCLYCLGWYLSATEHSLGSSCECGENVCEDDQRAEFYSEQQHEPEPCGVNRESEDM